jgi:hypothetical protein
LRAWTTSEEALGMTEMVALRFWMVKQTVTLRPFMSLVAFAISSPTFLGDWTIQEQEEEGKYI